METNDTAPAVKRSPTMTNAWKRPEKTWVCLSGKQIFFEHLKLEDPHTHWALTGECWRWLCFPVKLKPWLLLFVWTGYTKLALCGLIRSPIVAVVFFLRAHKSHWPWLQHWLIRLNPLSDLPHVNEQSLQSTISGVFCSIFWPLFNTAAI